MNKVILVILTVLSSGCMLYSQSCEEEILKLKLELRKTNEQLKMMEMLAVETANRAQRLRYIALAKELAEKSSSINDKGLKGLLALQAHRFNEAHGGYTFENDVFVSLSKALKGFNYQVNSVNSVFEAASSSMKPFSIISNLDGLIIIKDNKTGQQAKLMGHTTKVNQIAFTHNGYLMASGDIAGNILIWNLMDATRVPLSIEAKKPIRKLEFSIDDGQIRAMFTKSKYQIWLMSNRAMAAELEKFLTRNFTKEEWGIFIAMDLPYEKTITALPEGN